MVSITRLFDFPYYQQETYNLPVALATKKNGVWEKTSSQEYIAKANAVSRALLRMGVQKDDKIALITSTYNIFLLFLSYLINGWYRL